MGEWVVSGQRVVTEPGVRSATVVGSGGQRLGDDGADQQPDADMGAIVVGQQRDRDTSHEPVLHSELGGDLGDVERGSPR